MCILLGVPRLASETVASTLQVTLNKAEGLETWYTIGLDENDNPATIGGDTVAPNAELYKDPFNVGHLPEPCRCVPRLLFLR